jgi:hypothetical protein
MMARSRPPLSLFHFRQTDASTFVRRVDQAATIVIAVYVNKYLPNAAHQRIQQDLHNVEERRTVSRSRKRLSG